MGLILDRAPKTDDELWWLTQAMWNHRIPRTKVCPDHDAPFDAFATAYFEREPMILIHGSRGLAGKSRTLSILGLTKAAIKGADVNILGGSLNQSNNIHQTMRDAWDSTHAPKYMVQDDSMTLIKLKNGAKIRPLTASQKTVRGPHPPFLLLDEIDEMDQSILDAALGQPMPQKNWRGEVINAQTTMSSTWQYPDKTFAEMYRRFHDEQLPVFTWCAAGDRNTGVITKRGEVWIEDITTDDEVLTRQGWRPVQHVTYTGDRQCYDVVTSAGNHFRVTGEHKVFTSNRGWVEARLLSPGDSVVVTLADTTVPPVVSGADVGVVGRVPVSVGALGTTDLVEHATRELGVLPSGHRGEMRRIAAQRLVTGVVQSGGSDRTDLPQVDQSMNQLLTPLVATGDDAVALGVGSALPDPATILPDDVPLQPIVVDDQALGDVSAGAAPDGLLADGLPAVETAHVVSVTAGAIYPTYDIGVHDVHEFFANGVVVSNCYKETSNPVDGWLDPNFIAQKKREIPAEMWRVEYELGEPSIGNRAFDSEAVEATFSIDPEQKVKQERERTGDLDREYVHKVSRDYEEYQFEKPRMDTDYVIAADWAKSQDFTVITVYKVTHEPIEVVYWVRMRRRPYPVMIEHYNKLMQYYSAEGIHDATGLGGVVADYLDDRARGFMMSGMQRDNMLSEYISAVENGKVRAPRVESFYKAHLYCSVEDVYSRGKEFHLPDEVCSMALGWHLVSRRSPAVAPVVIKHNSDANWMEKEIRENAQARKQGAWVVGRVRNKTEEAESQGGFDIMV